MSDLPKSISEKLKDLLQGMLAPIRQVGEAPLKLRIDRRAIAEVAWRDLLAEVPAATQGEAWSTAAILAELDQLVVAAVSDDRSPAPTVSQPSTDSMESEGDVVSALGLWLDRLFEGLRSIDRMAVEILGLRLEGFDNRAISEGLDTGQRLVESIVADIRECRRLTHAMEEELASC